MLFIDLVLAEVISLDSNQFTGRVPSMLGSSKRLRRLYLVSEELYSVPNDDNVDSASSILFFIDSLFFSVFSLEWQ